MNGFSFCEIEPEMHPGFFDCHLGAPGTLNRICSSVLTGDGTHGLSLEEVEPTMASLR